MSEFQTIPQNEFSSRANVNYRHLNLRQGNIGHTFRITTPYFLNIGTKKLKTKKHACLLAVH